MTSQGTLVVLHVFGTGEKDDGRYPAMGLVQARDGSLYGTTTASTRKPYGAAIYRLSPGGAYEVLHYFSLEDGQYPSALIQADDGDFYGTALHNGAQDGGTAFRLAPDGAYLVLHEFGVGGAEGYGPYGALVQERDGLLYGVAIQGGSRSPQGCGGYGCGTVYRMTLDGTLTVLHSFGEGTPGQFPSSLTSARGHRLLGMTQEFDSSRNRVHVFGIGERD